MALLVEEPIDIPNNVEDIGNNEEIDDDKENIPNNERNNAEEPQEIVAAPEAVAKRKPGRPAGSRNREQGRARPGARKPKKVEVVEEPIEEVSEVFEDPIEPPESEYQRIPTVATTSKEERMLRLLSDHAKSRRARKVALWKSWF